MHFVPSIQKIKLKFPFHSSNRAVLKIPSRFSALLPRGPRACRRVFVSRGALSKPERFLLFFSFPCPFYTRALEVMGRESANSCAATLFGIFPGRAPRSPVWLGGRNEAAGPGFTSLPGTVLTGKGKNGPHFRGGPTGGLGVVLKSQRGVRAVDAMSCSALSASQQLGSRCTT